MKKILLIVFFNLGIAALSIQSFSHEKISDWIQKPFQISAEEKRLKDWILYEKFILNMEIPKLEPFPQGNISKNYLDQMLLTIVKNTPKVIESNNNNRPLAKVVIASSSGLPVQRLS
ncbi:hypothetical protein [Acinetobacter thermotolerans]|uniref:hypothetical protein n=1 Tax=Acinetobacter thermotolerans TaxID=3151487 RepID=UPI00325BB6EB